MEKKENQKVLEKEFSDKKFKYAEVLGINNIEYVM